VPEYQNPAGRLHALLTSYGGQRKVTIRQAWALALDVTEEDVPLHLGAVAALLSDVRSAALETGSDAFDLIPEHLRTLSRCVFPITDSFIGDVGNALPDERAMEALKMLSAYLEGTMPEGTIPTKDEVGELRESARELRDDVIAADLAPEIKRELLHRLGDVLDALDHLHVGGPDAVRRAAESLALATVLFEADTEGDRAVFTRLKSLAKKAWVAFTVATSLANAVLTWERILDLGLLESGQEQRQLLPGSTPDTGDESGSSE
jgi:hypothetical protein